MRGIVNAAEGVIHNPIGLHNMMFNSGTAPKRRQTLFRNVTPGEPYTQLPNAMLRDTRLDLDERGALADILSRPTHWNFSKEHFCQQNRIGRDRCQRIIRALEKIGYCKRQQDRTPDGKLGSAVYLFSAIPNNFGTVSGKTVDGEPLAGNPSTAEPWTGFSTREIKEREKEKTGETPPSEEGAQERAAAEFEPVEVTQPGSIEDTKRTKPAKQDVFGNPAKGRSPKVEFGENWKPSEAIIAFGLSQGLTEQETFDGFQKCKRNALENETKRTMEGWKQRIAGWLEEDGRNKLKRGTNVSTHRGRRSNEDLAAEVWGGQ